MRRLLAIVVFAIPGTTLAVQDEIAVGIQGGLALPAFKSTSTTDFALATWIAGVHASYGLLDDLYLTFAFNIMMFDGESGGYTCSYEGLDYTGVLRTSSRVYLPELGVKWRFYGGHNLSPYLEVSVGYGWATYRDSSLYNDEGLNYGIKIEDFGEGFGTLTAGLSVDYRLENTVLVGLGVRFTYELGSGDLLQHQITVPIEVSYFW